METKKIYELIPKIMNDIGSIGKDATNDFDKYKFRSIDAVYNALQPALSRNGVFIIPRVLESHETTGKTKSGGDNIRVKVKVEYEICASDGSSVKSIFEGEGIDTSDKATNKAVQAAFKYMLTQLFCIAFEGSEDSDKESPEVTNQQTKQAPPPPLQKNNLQSKFPNHEELIKRFQQLGISKVHIESKFQKSIINFSKEEISEPIIIGKKIKDGVLTKEQAFGVKQ